jgi:hypothetical protein
MNFPVISRNTKKRIFTYQQLRELAKRTGAQQRLVQAWLHTGRSRSRYQPVVDRLKLHEMMCQLTEWSHQGCR